MPPTLWALLGRQLIRACSTPFKQRVQPTWSLAAHYSAHQHCGVSSSQVDGPGTTMGSNLDPAEISGFECFGGNESVQS